jgi:hypothetical protein
MPKAVWDLKRGSIDGFDRSKQFKPFTGQQPPVRVVYKWRVARLTYAAAIGGKVAQLRIGLELIARSSDEKKYNGYYITLYRSITDNNQFTYVPFLDTLGVSEIDFLQKTFTDNEGKVLRIGQWKNDGTQEVLGQLVEREDQNGEMRRDVGWIGVVEDEPDEDDDEDEEYENDEDDEEYEDDELGF